jgi:hypothetical protein
MLLHELLSLAMFTLAVEGAHISYVGRQAGGEGLGDYPPYTGPCETESALIRRRSVLSAC